MKNEYALLLHSSGLSAAEAAALHKVKKEAVADWLEGRSAAPQQAIHYLYRLVDLQAHGARWLVRAIAKDPMRQTEQRARLCENGDGLLTKTKGSRCV